jgi:DNA primase
MMGINAGSSAGTKTVLGRRIDWKDIKDQVDLVRVVTALLGPAAKRQGLRLLWCCPFHDDRHPSFVVDPQRGTWRCWPCNLGGDAIALVRQLEPGMTFPEAVRRVARLSDLAMPDQTPMYPLRSGGGGSAQRCPRAEAPDRGHSAPATQRSADPTGLSSADALALVTEAAGRLWTSEGARALEYLRGRGLTDETIRAARLGYVASVWIPTRDQDRSYQASGVVIPWFEADRLRLAKIRQPEGAKPKYVEAFRDRPRIFPGLEAIRPARPLIVVEGELDALLLAQELRDLAAVVTFGSASNQPEPGIYPGLMLASWLFLALDGDAAGDRSAASWPPRAIRGRPPGAFKDWTDAAQAGLNLRCFWSDRIGQATAMPNGDEPAAEPDWYAIEERQAIQNEPP